MIAPDNTLDGLKRQRPEWEPWLVVVGEMLREAADPAWEAAVPAVDAQRTAVPLLAGATISLHSTPVRRFFTRLIRTASNAGTPGLSTLKAVLDADLKLAPLFEAALCQDDPRIQEMAAVPGADTAALHAVIALLPVPFLQACNRRWASSVFPGWVEGYCPVCGSWPAFAEVRGIERNRYYRCARCGVEWLARALNCAFCATSDHNELAVLVPEQDSSNTIEACHACLGYVKTYTRLQGCAPGAAMLEDLAGVDLDVAACEYGFARPSTPGYNLGVTVTDDVPHDTSPKRRFFSWKS
jgi:FdhE protein